MRACVRAYACIAAEVTALYRTTIEPAYRSCAGFLGAHLLVDRSTSGAPRCAALSTWRAKEALASSQESALYRQARAH